jgi:hypothetical protein
MISASIEFMIDVKEIANKRHLLSDEQEANQFSGIFLLA